MARRKREREAAPLTEYAWKFRYPGDIGERLHTDAEQALETARNVFEAVLDRLRETVRPPGERAYFSRPADHRIALCTSWR